MNFIRKYFVFPEGRKEWAVTGPMGSISFWATPHSPEWAEKYGETHYGGVEYHYKIKPEDESCFGHHLDCHANGGECWHDGTSLWASEHWIPHILPYGPERIWEELELTYKKHFGDLK